MFNGKPKKSYTTIYRISEQQLVWWTLFAWGHSVNLCRKDIFLVSLESFDILCFSGEESLRIGEYPKKVVPYNFFDSITNFRFAWLSESINKSLWLQLSIRNFSLADKNGKYLQQIFVMTSWLFDCHCIHKRFIWNGLGRKRATLVSPCKWQLFWINWF